mmetsp:Transcript_58827/g.140082  ORF Transcript_58827/g.140082 Transcript_58827/m.140082 type:complete len:314 (+) Transcript_58827:436-1377(+)
MLRCRILLLSNSCMPPPNACQLQLDDHPLGLRKLDLPGQHGLFAHSHRLSRKVQSIADFSPSQAKIQNLAGQLLQGVYFSCHAVHLQGDIVKSSRRIIAAGREQLLHQRSVLLGRHICCLEDAPQREIRSGTAVSRVNLVARKAPQEYSAAFAFRHAKDDLREDRRELPKVGCPNRVIDIFVLQDFALPRRDLQRDNHVLPLLRPPTSTPLHDGLDGTAVIQHVRLVLPFQELQLEDQRGIRRDQRWRAQVVVREARSDSELCHLALRHCLHSQLYSLDDLSRPLIHNECEGLLGGADGSPVLQTSPTGFSSN